jgi:hypothetical protein
VHIFFHLNFRGIPKFRGFQISDARLPNSKNKITKTNIWLLR